MVDSPRAPSTAIALWRGLRRRCPRCGARGWFRWWLVRTGPRCPRCGMLVERHEGFMLGSITCNTIATFALLAVVIVVGFVVSYPDIAVVPMVLTGAAIAVVAPVVLFPVSITTWAAIDLLMRPMEPVEVAEALTAVAAAGRVGGTPP